MNLFKMFFSILFLLVGYTACQPSEHGDGTDSTKQKNNPDTENESDTHADNQDDTDLENSENDSHNEDNDTGKEDVDTDNNGIDNEDDENVPDSVRDASLVDCRDTLQHNLVVAGDLGLVRVFDTNSLELIDHAAGQLLGTIETGPCLRAMALAPDGRIAYIEHIDRTVQLVMIRFSTDGQGDTVRVDLAESQTESLPENEYTDAHTNFLWVGENHVAGSIQRHEGVLELDEFQEEEVEEESSGLLEIRRIDPCYRIFSIQFGESQPERLLLDGSDTAVCSLYATGIADRVWWLWSDDVDAVKQGLPLDQTMMSRTETALDLETLRSTGEELPGRYDTDTKTLQVEEERASIVLSLEGDNRGVLNVTFDETGAHMGELLTPKEFDWTVDPQDMALSTTRFAYLNATDNPEDRVLRLYTLNDEANFELTGEVSTWSIAGGDGRADGIALVRDGVVVRVTLLETPDNEDRFPEANGEYGRLLVFVDEHVLKEDRIASVTGIERRGLLEGGIDVVVAKEMSDVGLSAFLVKEDGTLTERTPITASKECAGLESDYSAINNGRVFIGDSLFLAGEDKMAAFDLSTLPELQQTCITW